ncbi:Uncharacterised protein [Zhongshania aliphaticivorans]|uniref:Uncharacterized protein n=1 Tax=Zhongshania aliphaticivorans TaxID=1470434 RepID=A0A5S9NC35_9GAMM|nr:LruC domain-containing protein [Zhongshania aliphaticivorans]CAA0086996.1 Uncharacterised protein [Zhongshania aliphaticivorans]CAA0113873.1 Uncharacterised protein [Zhongshania aliphaticivorans]
MPTRNFTSNTLRRSLLGCVIGSASIVSYASPFTQCPSEAFLVQDRTAQLYSVQLATGYSSKINPSPWTSAKYNALAFSTHDSYLYAFNYETGSLVKISSDMQLEQINVDMQGKSFYVGDIALDDNAYYLYKSNTTGGLYRISLDPTADDFLKFEKVVSGNKLGISIFDMAFHPYNGLLYAVDKNGVLWQIDKLSGEKVNLGSVGESGTFGAAYFDVNGYLYMSRNNDGKVFQIDVEASSPQAVFYAAGPASSNNDGARCALAPIVSEELPTIDFGNAPDSYASLLENNGARHDMGDGELFLGSSVNYEPNAEINTSQAADNDGVIFINTPMAGSAGLLELSTSKNGGYANIWADWNQNGEFEDDEQIVIGLSVSSGSNLLNYTVPSDAQSGQTWVRVRLSSIPTLTSDGGAPDGEVEDYQIDVTATEASYRYYPSEFSSATLVFEDNWPLMGDYDMNDVVIQYRLSVQELSGNIQEITIEGEVVAHGASYHNGFAFRLPGLLANDIDGENIDYQINDVAQVSPLEQGRNEAIVIIANDMHDYTTPGEDCKYYRTEKGCGSQIQMRFSMTIPVSGRVSVDQLGDFPFDPFIFASPGYTRNYLFGEAPGRRFEIHLKNQAPTEAFQDNFFGRGDDASEIGNGEYFVNQNGMPWALNIPTEWNYPLEYMDIKFAYPNFHSHVQSGGEDHQDWHIRSNAIIKNLFVN